MHENEQNHTHEHKHVGLGEEHLGWFLAKIVADQGGHYEIPAAATRQEIDLSIEFDPVQGLWTFRTEIQETPLVAL